MTIEVVDLTDGELIAVGPLRIRVLEDGSHTDHRLGIVEVTLPPHTGGPPQHVHRQHDETFFVVSGTPSFICGAERVQGRPGMLVTAAIGTAHTFLNTADIPAVMLCTVTPDQYIGYFRDLANLPPGPPDPHTMGTIMSRYATDVVHDAT